MSYCDCDYDGDAPAFCEQWMVKKARKQHRCDECGGPVFVGESYKRTVGVWDGEFQTYLECSPCLELREWATISVPCFCANTFGSLHENVADMVEDVRENVPGFFFEYGRRMVKINQRRPNHVQMRNERLERYRENRRRVEARMASA